MSSPDERPLDFILIGAQKAGTTSLWHYLRGHPRIEMPDRKESPVFCLDEEQMRGALPRLMASLAGDAAPDSRLGIAATYYMMGRGAANPYARGQTTVDVARVAERIASAYPEVRLIALLRDPIERAFSHYRMSVRRGWESRGFATAVEELLEPAGLAAGRQEPTETNSYLAQGEYGRILDCYRAWFPAERMHVETTEALGEQPAEVLDRVLRFLSLPAGYRPPRIGARHHRGGTRKLLDSESEDSLLEFMGEHVWPNLGEDAERVRHLFQAFFGQWNVAPEEERPQLSPAVRQRLEAHYEADAELLARLGIRTPWVAAW